MPTITDHDQIIQDLRARLEESEHERERLTIAIADHVEALGFEGRDADALVDARGQIERLLDGKDLEDDFESLAGRVATSVKCNVTTATLFAGTFGDCFSTVMECLQSALRAIASVDIVALQDLVKRQKENAGAGSLDGVRTGRTSCGGEDGP